MTERSYQYRKRTPAKGHRCNGHVRIVCAFDPDTWAILSARAAKRQTSMAEEVRTLVEWGLEADKP